ncbi:MAG TPA: hypothetical protein VGS06_43115 [Streptosporangiaceae bacterium]|nr:hypothetical protein [Streptosporangiaceae bacterium]
MRVPQVSERIKEAPAQALRGVFAGIGQLLLITDKLRNKTSASQQVPRARAPEPSERVSPAAGTPAEPPAPAPVSAAAPAPSAASASAAPAPSAAPAAPAAADRDFDKTGNVRLLTSAEAAAGDTAPAVDATVAGSGVTGADPVAEPAPVVTAPVAAAAPGAPLPNYDELSVASLRARLRNLDVAQLRQLVEYESAHAGRTDVITMFERRITKLEAETSPEERGEAAAEAQAEAREAVEAEVQDEIGAEAEGEA